MKKGFTLIELLAVIIILGILMLIAIPSVTGYINNSRKNGYVDSAKNIIDGAVALVNSGEFDIFDKDTTYYIPGDCVPLESGKDSSPYSEWDERYIVVTYDGDSYDYYWTSYDKSNMGINLGTADSLEASCVQSDVDGIDTSIGIGDRSKIYVYDKNNSCKTGTPVELTKSIGNRSTCKQTMDLEVATGSSGSGSSGNEGGGEGPSQGGSSTPVVTPITTDGGRTWEYGDVKIYYTNMDGNGCDNQNGLYTCHNATVRIENSHATKKIFNYEAKVTLPAGAQLIQNYDSYNVTVTIDNNVLTVKKSNANMNMIEHGNHVEYRFAFKYPSNQSFSTSNADITVEYLNDVNITKYVYNGKLKLEFKRKAIDNVNNKYGCKYDITLENLTDSPVTGWNFNMELPEGITALNLYDPYKINSRNGNAYVIGSYADRNITTIGAHQKTPASEFMLEQTSPNLEPVFS